MLLDSGADVTLVPAEAVQTIEAEAVPDIDYELEGFGDAIVRAKAVQLDLRFADLTFRGNFLIVEQKWGIIGRNVLNHLCILLDGPSLSWYRK